VRAVVFVPMLIGFAGLLAIKLNELRKDPGNLFLRWLCVVLTFAAVSAGAGVPAVATALETRSGVPAVWIMVPVTAACAAFRSTYILWTDPLPAANRKIRLGLIVYAGAIAAIIALSAAAGGSVSTADIVRHEQSPELLWATTPHVRDAFLVYCAATGFAYAEAVVRIRSVVRQADRRWLRRGLRNLVASYALFDLYIAASCGYFLTVRLGNPVSALCDAGLVAAFLAGLAATAGIGLPALGPRWDRMRSYRRLEHLWAAVHQAVPHIVLERPRLAVLDAWNPWRSDFRLYRRVIEIRDGIFALRPYFDPAVGAAARRMAERDGQSPAEIEATVLAARLRAAARVLDDGFPAAASGDRSPADPLPGGHDLDTEIELLLPVARAFATSPIVNAAATTAARLPAAR
jgi:uncharacterized protein DUF6545